MLFLIANSMESGPRVVALAQLHKTCGAPDFSFAHFKPARGGSDSRTYLLRVVLFLIVNSMESEPREFA